MPRRPKQIRKSHRRNGDAAPAPSGPIPQTHVALPIPVVNAIARVLNRVAMEGQEAQELLEALRVSTSGGAVALEEPPAAAPPETAGA